ncbi:MAG TPA: tetratricopeptide repeat protein, partial [Anaerolineales bacterium]|nr:tetratricopeptide repeat protein [Anaerolineales bacterium]
FDFGSPLVTQALTGKLSTLNKYNGLRVYSEYFFEAMSKLRDRYMKVEAANFVLPTLNADTQKITETQKTAASEARPVEKKQLTAQEWFERGYVFTENKNFDEAIRCYSESISIKLDFTEAYNNRGNARFAKDDLDGAISDYIRAIRIRPDFTESYYNCATVLEKKKDYVKAISAYQKYLDLKGGVRYGNQKEVENLILELRARYKELNAV